MKQGVKFLIGAGVTFGTIGSAVVSFPQIAEAATVYTVVSGDTLWGISRKYEVTVANLMSWNKLNSDLIRPGQKLYVSDPSKGNSGGSNPGNSGNPGNNDDKEDEEEAAKIDDGIANGRENIADANDSLYILENGNQAIFTSADATRQKFYGELTKRIDPKAGNRLYKRSQHGFTFFSPIREKNGASGGVSTGEYIFENMNVEYNRGTMKDLWIAEPSRTRNFKTKRLIRENANKGMDREKMSKVGVYVENSPFVNNGGHFKNETGVWRFNGYTRDGASSQDGLLPADYISFGIENTDWDYYATYGPRLFKPNSIYNGDRHRNAKLTLIRRLMKQVPELSYKKDTEWMKILSLQTIPEVNPLTGDRDGTYGGAQFMGYNSNGTRYKSVILYADAKTGHDNLNLQRLTLAENGSNYPAIKTVTRKEAETRNTNVSYEKKDAVVVPGQTYRIITGVQNLNKLVATEHSPTTVDIGFAKNYKDSFEPHEQYNKLYDNVSGFAKKSGTIAKGATVSPEGTLTIPEDALPGSKIRLGAIINEEHQAKGDNLDPSDDDLLLTVKVATGNLKAKDVVLIDTNGKEVSDPIPGNQYKIRYKFKYDGPTLATNTDVTVNYQNVRKVPDGKGPEGGSDTITNDTSASKSIRLVDGNSYHIDTQRYQWYELPWVSTQAYLSSSVSGLNSNSGDDKWSKTWDPKYDYSIKNLQVIPRTEYSNTEATDGKQHYGVSFTVVSDMPKAAKDDNYAKDVVINVNLGGERKVIKEHITAGENRDVVVDMAFDSPVRAESVVDAEVFVNSDSRAYEYGVGASNNIARTRVNTNGIYRDSRSKALVNPTNTTSNTGAYVTEPVDPNGKTSGNSDNKSNSWNQTYDIESWTGKKVTYAARNGKKSFSFYRYTPTSNYNRVVGQNENYRIQDVLIKSKVTSDNRWGNNGWVSMLSDSGHAQVKAGSGYQLKMIVEYNTNAFSTQPNSSINGGNGTSVRPTNIMPNIARDAYFQTSDGKILSASGINSTNQVLQGRVLEQTKEKLVMEYTLADTYTMGIRTPGRVYISEDTPNGMYNVRAWTPEINGVPTKNKRVSSQGFTTYQPEPLWDILGNKVSDKPVPLPTKGKDSEGNPVIDLSRVPDMSIVVIGSNKDDIVNSVVQ